jgi:hypothetical protein
MALDGFAGIHAIPGKAMSIKDGFRCGRARLRG